MILANESKILSQIGGTPINRGVLASLFPTINDSNKKIRQLESNNAIIRLKKGTYIVSPEFSRVPINTYLIANHLSSPSYVSMLSALRYYGMIPEDVYIVQSMTLNKSKQFDNKLGTFTYHHTDQPSFSIGLNYYRQDETAFVIASPEKALCDYIANTPYINLRYLSETERFLEDDLRLDMDAFRQMDINIFRQYAFVGKKKNSIETIIKLLEK